MKLNNLSQIVAIFRGKTPCQQLILAALNDWQNYCPGLKDWWPTPSLLQLTPSHTFWPVLYRCFFFVLPIFWRHFTCEQTHRKMESSCQVEASGDINPGLRSRNYWKAWWTQEPSKLKLSPRSHYHEKRANELYPRLSKLAQQPQESLQSFVIRALYI